MKLIHNIPRPRPSRGGERGYSLVELLVAMVIAVFLLAGLFTIFQGTRHTSTEQTGLAELQDEERLAMTLMTDIIQSAGYYTDVVNGSVSSALGPDGGNFQAGQSLYGVNTGTTQGETLTVRFQTASDDTVLNCVGQTNSSGSSVVYSNTFAVVVNAAGVSQLVCTAQTGIPAAAGPTAVPLVNNVESLQFQYAVNTTGADAFTPSNAVGTSTSSTNNSCPGDTYKTTLQMTADDWTNVCAVEVTITLLNPLYQPAGQPTPTPGQPQNIQFQRVISVLSKAGVNVANAVTGS